MKEKTPKIDAPAPKTPAEKIKYFVDYLNLGPLLPEEFKNLSEAQQLKVTQDLKQRIVDIVKSDAQTQYSEDLKQRGNIAKIRASINKESEIKNFETKAFKAIGDTEEGKKLIIENLAQLTEMTKGRDVYLNPIKNNKPEIVFISPNDFLNLEGGATINEFNITANNFREMPYEWGQEKGGKHKKEYEKAKAEYEKARAGVLEIEEKKKGKETALTDMLQLDNLIQMDQLINTHPEFEAELIRLSNKDTKLTQAKDVWNMIGGKGTTNKLLFVGGYGARIGVKAVSVASSMTVIGALGASAVGGLIGGLRARFRAKDTLQEKQKGARRGKKDESKEKDRIVSVVLLTNVLKKLIDGVENPTTPTDSTKILSKLAAAIEHSQERIEKGQVNFGDSKSALANQFNFIDSLNKALVLKEMNIEKINIELKEKISKLIKIRNEEIAGKISKTQSKFIAKQMLNGAILGAGAATIGYGVRLLGEHFGWWGGHGTGIVAPKTPTSTHSVLTSTRNAPSAPTEPSGIKIPPNVPETPPATKFANEGIKFEHGRGGIKGVLELLKQKDPNATNAQAIKEAIKLGLYDPNNPNESALIREGSTLKFDAQGNLIFHDAKTGENVTHYVGKMFDSDGSTKISTTEHIDNPSSEPETPDTPASKSATERILDAEKDKQIHENADEARKGLDEMFTEKPKVPELKTAEALKKQISEHIDRETGKINTADLLVNKPGLRTGGHGNYYENQPLGFGREYPDQFQDISHGDNLILQNHPEFADNPFNLSGEKLMQAYDASHENMEYLFGNEPSTWSKLLSTLRLRADKVLEYTNGENSDPTIKRLSKYLRSLKDFTGLKPESNFLWKGAENSEHYIARALQKVASLGKLEEFQASL